MVTTWTPTPLPLNAGPPFPYDDADISNTSRTTAFRTRIDRRDAEWCIVCGYDDTEELQHTHIVPKVENSRVRCSYY